MCQYLTLWTALCPGKEHIETILFLWSYAVFCLKLVLKNLLKLNPQFVIIPFHWDPEQVILLQNICQVPSMLVKLKESKINYWSVYFWFQQIGKYSKVTKPIKNVTKFVSVKAICFVRTLLWFSEFNWYIVRIPLISLTYGRRQSCVGEWTVRTPGHKEFVLLFVPRLDVWV